MTSLSTAAITAREQQIEHRDARRERWRALHACHASLFVETRLGVVTSHGAWQRSADGNALETQVDGLHLRWSPKSGARHWELWLLASDNAWGPIHGLASLGELILLARDLNEEQSA